jgi:hypothetical protein
MWGLGDFTGPTAITFGNTLLRQRANRVRSSVIQRM